MKVMSINQQNKQTFKMNLSCDEQALKILKQGADSYYLEMYEPIRKRILGRADYNFNQLFSEFTDVFKTDTFDNKGTAVLKKHPMSKGDLMVSYIGEDGKVYELANGNGAVCINANYLLTKYQCPKNSNTEKPFWDSTLNIVAAIGGMFCGKGYPLHNMQVHKQWLEYYYKLANKIVPKDYYAMQDKEDYIEKVKNGVIDDVLNYGIKKTQK